MLSGMDARMQKMKFSQARIDEDERMRGADESGLFASLRSADFAGRLHRGALERLEPRERHVSAQARHVGSRLGYLRMGALHPAQQRTKPLPQAPPQLPPYQPQLTPQAPPGPPQQAPALTQYRVPDARQRKLAIRKLDGTEVYAGLGSAFWDWADLLAPSGHGSRVVRFPVE
uniref:Uncharacterized protein n=1 Tax=Peronospora matthiolae TaxID=2874970 RepID=A0AAV1TRR8_9STRA